MPRASSIPTYARVSGQVVLVSGQPVKISGEQVVVQSGVYLASGIYVVTAVTTNVSGQPVFVHSGEIHVVSGAINVVSGLVVAKVSGESVIVTSGVVAASVSGNIIIAKISGESVVVTSGVVVSKVSGEVVDIKVPTSITSGGIFAVSAVSGGVILTSGPCVSVTIKALSKNSGDIYISGVPMQSGQGFVLEPGEAINLDVDNFGRIRLLAMVSGDRVTYVGVL
ncbi:MAG: hypothetical protein K6T73_07385 [Candidatus Bathyarchaeota archaeon]|nr:hypothetical protein [Candidatus Bathyarchaeota archaeon]